MEVILLTLSKAIARETKRTMTGAKKNSSGIEQEAARCKVEKRERSEREPSLSIDLCVSNASEKRRAREVRHDDESTLHRDYYMYNPPA
jgi:hypothetical protein